MTKINPNLDVYFKNLKKWPQEFERLRKIILPYKMGEEFKWRWPCYTYQGSNIVLIHGFKEYCALLFFKGALLKDPKGILVQPGALQAGRQIRFGDLQEIIKMESVVKAYIREAIEVEKAGLKVKLKKTSDFEIPEEFKSKLNKTPALKAAFDALTPGRQRGYIFYFSAAKQSKTREMRIEKCMKLILSGKGLSD